MDQIGRGGGRVPPPDNGNHTAGWVEVVKTVAPKARRREAGMRLDIPKPRAKACAGAGRLLIESTAPAGVRAVW